MKNKWFAYHTDNDNSDVKLLLFPYAGGGPSLFVQWKKFIHSSVGVYPVLYPFREARRSEKLPETVQQLGKKLAIENEDIFSGKYAIFAHCAGASIAYETIIEAKKRYNTEPIFMIVSGAEPPEFSLNELKYLENSDEDQFLDYLIKSGFADESVRSNQGFLSYYLPIIKADFNLLFSYSYTHSEKLHCPIHIFYGKGDKVIDFSRLSNWREYTCGKVDKKVFDGGHYYFTTCVEQVCNEINTYMEN